MGKFYSGAEKILVAVDCLVFGYDISTGKLKILLVKRRTAPLADHWSLVGSFVQPDEDLRSAAARVLFEFTGMKDIFFKQLKCFGKLDRDPGDRVISIAYWALIKLEDHQKHLSDKNGAMWFDITDVPELVIDHHQMLDEGLLRIRNIADNFPIGKELLPQHFTLPQLHQLYEAIYQREIDDRNFRKKILSTKMLIKLDKKDKNSSKKGAFYFKFDEVQYEDLLTKGYHINW